MTNSGGKAYAADGVDVAKEADFSSYAGALTKETYSNSPFVAVQDLSAGAFRGPRPFTLQNLPDGYITEMSADGLGTKGILIDAADSFETAAYDLLAMVTSDITRYGGLPLVLTNILDVAEVGETGEEANNRYRRLIAGLAEGAKDAGVVVLKGETAQMSACIGSEIPDSPSRFNWGSTMLGVYHKDKVVTGDTLASGQVVIALKENGFRCNGISSVRKALAIQYGAEWWSNPEAQADIKAAATPSVLYDKFVNTLMGWYSKDFTPEVTLHAILHISGGGIKEKLGHDLLFKRGFSAELTDLFAPPEIMQKCAAWRGIEDEEFYEAWNGGQGMLLVVDESEADAVVARAQDFSIEAKVAGAISESDQPELTVRSTLSDKVVKYAAAN